MNLNYVFKKYFSAVILLAFFVFTPHTAFARQFGSGLVINSFILSGPIGLIRPPKTLTDPQATSESKSLMSFLVDYYGQQVLSGQQDLGAINYIYSITGKKPAVGCFDLMEYSPSRIEHGANPTGLSESYINWADSGGGIVSLCWHWNAPTDLINEPNAEWWRGFYTFATTFDIQAVLADPEGERYQLLIRDLDAIAVQLAKFQDANLPVLWRPLHEASGGWFWWGAKGPGPFIELWRLMHDRYVNYHGLHNLIWVYTVGDPAWYPGDDYVDIASMDIYPSDPNTSMVGFWLDSQSHFEGVKLVTLSESGILPDPDKIRADKVWWSWFSVWGGDFIYNTNQSFLDSVYHDEDIITLDELIDWKHYPVEGGAPVVSITQPAEGSRFAQGGNIIISANASDPCGAVTKVEFFRDEINLGEDTSAPYSFTLNNVPEGHYVLIAIATDNNGLMSDSQEVNITVGSPPVPIISRYEAENAVSDGPTLSTNFGGYSGIGAMLFDGDGGTGITFTVYSIKAGDYPLTIRYLIPSGSGDKPNTVLVNDEIIWTPNFTETNSTWSEFAFGNVTLSAGFNTVRIEHDWGWIYVDYIELELPRLGDAAGFILREWWTGISGTAVSNLTSDINYPNNPNGRMLITSLEGPKNWADNYGNRIRGYLYPPADGNYTFWIASDADSQLRLSTDADPCHAAQIAYVSGTTNSRQWTKYTSQTSTAKPLLAEHKYYIEALQKEGTGADNIAVAWQGPGITQQVIEGAYLSPWLYDFRDYAIFSPQWLKNNCNRLNVWCNGADRDRNGNVRIEDLKQFAEVWLLEIQ